MPISPSELKEKFLERFDIAAIFKRIDDLLEKHYEGEEETTIALELDLNDALELIITGAYCEDGDWDSIDFNVVRKRDGTVTTEMMFCTDPITEIE